MKHSTLSLIALVSSIVIACSGHSAAAAPAAASPAAAAQPPCQPGSYAGCAPAPVSKNTRLVPGKYACYGNGNYLFMDMFIVSSSVYKDTGGATGNYTFDPATQKITFTTGSLKGTNSKLLPVNRIGLTTKNDNFYATTCELEK